MPLFDELALLDYSKQFALELEHLQQQFQDSNSLGSGSTTAQSSALHRLRVPFVSWRCGGGAAARLQQRGPRPPAGG